LYREIGVRPQRKNCRDPRQETGKALRENCASLERRGRSIGLADTFIAAHARSEGLTLVTSNVRHFARVPRLKYEDWS
jgi:predicted nucleic acid-binding protein